MYGSQEKILGQKVNVKFFTVDPYSVGAGVPRTFLELGKIQKNIFLKIKTSIIKSVKISIKYSLLQNLNQISLHLIINTRHREASDYQIRLFLDDFPNGLFSIEIDQVKFSTQNNLENEIEDISLRGAYMFKDDRGQQLKYLTIPPSPLFTSLCLLAFPFAAPMTPCSSLRVYSLFSIPALIALSMIVIRKDSCEKNSCHPYVPNR